MGQCIESSLSLVETSYLAWKRGFFFLKPISNREEGFCVIIENRRNYKVSGSSVQILCMGLSHPVASLQSIMVAGEVDEEGQMLTIHEENVVLGLLLGQEQLFALPK